MGISLGLQPISMTLWLCILYALLCLIVLISLQRKLWLSFSFHLLLVFLGLALAKYHSPIEHVPARAKWSGLTKITDLPQEKAKTFAVTVRLQGERGLCAILYLQKSERASNLLPGDHIYISSTLSPVEPSGFPGEFNYAEYLKKQHCYYSCYVGSVDWIKWNSKVEQFNIQRYAAKCRRYFASILKVHLNTPTDALAIAMLLGDKSGLNKTLKSSFSDAGIMHILAVSGLHVGIIYMVVSLLLKPFSKGGHGWRIIGMVLEILAIWAFAIITGFGPSVQRAALMFSLFSVGRMRHSDSDVVNIIAGSALMILLIQPNMLLSAGFLLSYTAVLGIVLIYPKVVTLANPSNALIRWIWQLEVVSFAAVIATAPLSLFYFGKFPIVFFLANIMAIPAAFTIVIGSIVFLILHPFFWISYPVRMALEGTSWLLLKGTSMLTLTAWSTCSNVSVSLSEVVTMYLAIFAFILQLYANLERQRKLFLVTIYLIAVILLQHTADTIYKYQKGGQWISKKRDLMIVQRGHRQYRFELEHLDNPYPLTLDGHSRTMKVKEQEAFSVDQDQINQLWQSLQPVAPSMFPK